VRDIALFDWTEGESRMDRQAKSDDRDDKRVFRWGVIMVIVLVVLALLASYFLSQSRERSPVVQEPTSQAPQKPSTPSQ
jgi:cobalamin biosynthesis protein CobD/CbiB